MFWYSPPCAGSQEETSGSSKSDAAPLRKENASNRLLENHSKRRGEKCPIGAV